MGMFWPLDIPPPKKPNEKAGGFFKISNHQIAQIFIRNFCELL